jgi:hypothetical protein
MATSPIYSWPEPDNTDLVKNGALAIRTLGNAIDTTMGTMVAKTVVDAKGDLIAGTAADTVNRLAVGNNGETLVADSSTSTGLRYQAAKSFNYIINGGMDISQRGTSFVPTSGLYTLDRWFGQRYGSAGGTVSQVNTSDTTNLPQITKAMRIANNSGATATNTLILNSLENTQTQQLLGQTVAISFYLRKGANYSGADFTVALVGGTGTDQSLNAGYTGQATLLTVTAVPTTSWVRYQGTVTVGATYTQLGLVITSKGTGTAGANDWAEITGVQLELGSIATTFERSGGTIQGELSAAQRYYVRFTNGGAYQAIGNGSATATTGISSSVPLPVQMRTTPSSIDVGTLGFSDGVNAVITGTIALIASQSSPTKAYVAGSSLSASATQFRFYELITNNSATGFLGVNAEL